jgi:3-dehydroquinate synthase
MAEIEVAAAAGNYPVVVERGLSSGLGARLRDLAGNARVLVIADENTARLMGERLAADAGAVLFTVPPGETSKDFASLERACAAALDAGLDRDSTIVAAGGGVIGDLAGVVAAVYMRGVDLVQVPSTLLAMVDSAIGGKTAVNLPHAKNMVGAFKPPAAVFVDPELLLSLPEREYRSGLAEVLKYSMIADEQLYDTLLSNNQRVLARDMNLMTEIVTMCAAIKAGVVSRDERESGERAILNYGHTFGHALEAATGYGPFTHGEAISVGMAVAAGIGEQVGVTPEPVAQQQARLLEAYELPQRVPGAAASTEVEAAIGHDKKARARLPRWVLLERIGKAVPGHRVPVEVATAVIRAALAEA